MDQPVRLSYWSVDCTFSLTAFLPVIVTASIPRAIYITLLTRRIMPDIYFKCRCNTSLAVDDAASGKTANCPTCQQPVTIPNPDIKWRCQHCNSHMAAPGEMAGQTVQCVECSKDTTVPAPEVPPTLEQKEAHRCPSCGADIPPDYAICTRCGLNFKTGETMKATGISDVPKKFPVKAIAIAAVLLVCGIGVAIWIKPKSSRTSVGKAQTTARPVERVSQQLDPEGNQNITDAEQQFTIACQYLNGKGVPKDLSKAADLFQKAADKGHAEAQYNLGVCYHRGDGVSKDLTKAVEWWQKAAAQGDAGAQYNLGVCYEYGHGVPIDKDKAAKWYKKAAAQGYAAAERQLATDHENGENVIQQPTNRQMTGREKQEFDEAFRWYVAAVERKDIKALEQEAADPIREHARIAVIQLMKAYSNP